MKLFVKKYRWFALGLIALLVRAIFEWQPVLAENMYGRVMYPFLRLVLDNTLGYLPFPIFYILLLSLVLSAYFRYKRSKKVISTSIILRRAANILGLVVFWFYVLWGFNYKRPTLSERIGISAEDSIDIVKAAAIWSEKCSVLRQNSASESIENILKSKDYENDLRHSLSLSLNKLGMNTPGKARCREVSKHGLLRRIGISGIFFPFSCESYVDASQTGLTKVFAMTHEMSHGFGITDEGEANFCAWLAMTQNPDSIYQYLGYLELLRYGLYDLRYSHPEEYEKVKADLAPQVLKDFEIIKENSQKYPLLFPGLAMAANDAYLKAQGVEQGVASYDSFVTLAYNWSSLYNETSLFE
jgi:hypothetical protein